MANQVLYLLRPSNGLPTHLAKDLLLQLGVKHAGYAEITDVFDELQERNCRVQGHISRKTGTHASY